MREAPTKGDSTYRTRRLVTGMCWLLTALVTAQWINFYLFVLRARLTLGRWPSWDNPDPKTLGFDFHQWLVTSGGFVVLLSSPFVLLLVAIAALLGRAPWRPVSGALLALFFFVASAQLEAERFGNWFLD